MEIPKVYDPKIVEDKWYQFWLEGRFFSSSPSDDKEPFTIVIPPPNVTGSLHMGHALNNVLQDALVRFHRLQGENPLWVPGTDHGGIATQNVVEKLLLAEGKNRHALGREKFVERMWQWRKESGDTILMQLRRLGSSCDWERTRFTLDEQCSAAVTAAFVRLYQRGLIYRGKRMVNWCPHCHTALADIEVEHEEEIGKLWHLKYPLVEDNKKFIVVATTRPETMLGDTAVAVHPEDKRYRQLIGKKALLPLVGREIPIINDPAVDPVFGSGAVKITPAHDPLDFEIAQRHNIPAITVIDPKGKMTGPVGKYEGLDRYECRKIVLQDLAAGDYLLETVDHPHAVGRCYRCLTAIEPLVSEQWFLSTKEMAQQAMKAVEEEKIKFYPVSWSKPYLLWLENLQDWCISRQIWWGHRLPVWYCPQCKKEPIVSIGQPGVCPHCANKDLVQDPDVLDTWFSSALWPFSVFGWPKETADLNYYYPTSVVVTGHEILYLWVARMVMMGLTLAGAVPFRNVYIHGIVRDAQGKKMSKSLGNVIDPLVIIEKYGTDALRFSLTINGVMGRDMQISEDTFLGARNFCNKLWNAARFVLMNREKADITLTGPLELADLWISSEYNLLVKRVVQCYNEYNLAEASRLLYDFVWSKYCDWYVEIAKIRLYGTDEDARGTVRKILEQILAQLLLLLHPIMPFITEEINHCLAGSQVSLMDCRLSGCAEEKIDEAINKKMAVVIEAITAIRNIRSEAKVPLNKQISVIFNSKDPAISKMLEECEPYIKQLAKTEKITFGQTLAAPPFSAAAVVSGIEIFVPLSGLIDLEKEKERLTKEIKSAEFELNLSLTKLDNEKFLAKAPQTEIDKVIQSRKNCELKIAKLRESFENIEKLVNRK
ncbi:MAG: valine--tRNA ligase [Elusimicrobiota bacterium]